MDDTLKTIATDKSGSLVGENFIPGKTPTKINFHYVHPLHYYINLTSRYSYVHNR